MRNMREFLHRIRYLLTLKGSVSEILSHKYTKIRINSVNSLPLEKAINMENVKVAIKSLLNKKHNHYYYEKFFRKKIRLSIKCCIMIELTFLKSLMLIVYLKSILFETAGIS